MPAKSVYSSEQLTDLSRACDHVARLLRAVGHDIPEDDIAAAIMNGAATSESFDEICFKAFTRLSGDANQRH